MAETIYGVALNDRMERDRLAAAFRKAPYKEPPRAPVLHIKPAGCRTGSGATVVIPEGVDRLHVSPSFALLFGGPPGAIAGAALAVDISEPQPDYYRPAVRAQGGDGFLPLGPFQPWAADGSSVEILSCVDGEAVHRWSAERLVRDVGALVSEVGAFMTLSDGDILLTGLQVEPIPVWPGVRLTLHALGHPDLKVAFASETAA